MQATSHPEINQLLDSLLSQIQAILGKKLVGVYLYGSLVTGDFDTEISDIDVLAALSSEIDEKEFTQLQKMHTDFANHHKEWENRIEVRYLSLLALKTFKVQSSPIASIDPGEPFHIREVGKHWLMNWYVVREKGVTLFGPSPKSIIEPISKEEFIESVKDHTKSWGEWINDMHTRPAQAYAILTLCRALYSYTYGEQVSKKKAAEWAQTELPEWSSLIQNALIWRDDKREEQVDHNATYPLTARFVHFIIDRIVG